MFSNSGGTGKAFFGPSVYDVTGSTGVAVNAVTSTGYSYKTNLAANYQTSKVPTIGSNTRSSIYVSGTSIIGLDKASRWQCDPSTTTLNLQSTNIANSVIEAGNTFYTLMDTATAVYQSVINGGNYTTTPTGTLNGTPVDVASPITL